LYLPSLALEAATTCRGANSSAHLAPAKLDDRQDTYFLYAGASQLKIRNSTTVHMYERES
jgi:hypothetical protein